MFSAIEPLLMPISDLAYLLADNVLKFANALNIIFNVTHTACRFPKLGL